MKLLQRDVAERLGVTESSVWNWEANGSQPDFRHMPAIIAFLGYNPLPEAKTLAERLVRRRTTLGMSQKEAAGRSESIQQRWPVAAGRTGADGGDAGRRGAVPGR